MIKAVPDYRGAAYVGSLPAANKTFYIWHLIPRRVSFELLPRSLSSLLFLPPGFLFLLLSHVTPAVD
jgi:hypothetical protein